MYRYNPAITFLAMSYSAALIAAVYSDPRLPQSEQRAGAEGKVGDSGNAVRK